MIIAFSWRQCFLCVRLLPWYWPATVRYSCIQQVCTGELGYGIREVSIMIDGRQVCICNYHWTKTVWKVAGWCHALNITTDSTIARMNAIIAQAQFDFLIHQSNPNNLQVSMLTGSLNGLRFDARVMESQLSSLTIGSGLIVPMPWVSRIVNAWLYCKYKKWCTS